MPREKGRPKGRSFFVSRVSLQRLRWRKKKIPGKGAQVSGPPRNNLALALRTVLAQQDLCGAYFGVSFSRPPEEGSLWASIP